MSSDVRDRTAGPQTDTAPHPRIRARRVAVARDVGRVRRRRLNVVLALVCAVVWSMVGLRSSLVDVDRVQVDGAEQTPAGQVRTAAEVGRGEPMVSVDQGAAAEAVAALPWVDEVRVERMWPGTVRIVVVEREPVAVVATPTGDALVDGEGRVLAEAGSDTAPIRLEGRRDAAPGDTLPAADRVVLAVVGRLPPPLGADVEAATAEDRGVVLALGEGWSVVIGDDADLEAKAGAALAVRDAADPADGCTIDVRVPSAPVLTGGGRCA